MRLDGFVWGSRTLIVGILNLSPDSFSGDGLADVDAAVARGEQMAREGADVIDVGGQSTRPGFNAVSAEVEHDRVLPALAQLADRLPGTPLSIDTSTPSVANAAFDAGATILNDVNGLRGEPELAVAAGRRDVWVIAMHNQRGRGRARDPIEAVLGGTCASLALGGRYGVREERMIIDPGFGFGWELRENAELLRRLAELRVLGHPILVGISRKRMTGEQFGWGVEQRLESSAAATAIAIANGADLVRVHDVAAMARVVRMADDIVRR